MRDYGAIHLTVSSPAQSFTEPLTLTQAAKFLELPERSADPTAAEELEDAQLAVFISAARSVAEIEYGRDLVAKQYDLSLDDFYTLGCYSLAGVGWGSGTLGYSRAGSYGIRGREIELPEPLASVDLIRYRDSDGNYHPLVQDTDYIVDTARALVMPTYGNSWPSFTPWPSSAVLVRFTTGYASTHPFWSNAGKRILLGMRQLISAWYNGRLPFEPATAIVEYPYAVTSLFNYGAKRRVR